MWYGIERMKEKKTAQNCLLFRTRGPVALLISFLRPIHAKTKKNTSSSSSESALKSGINSLARNKFSRNRFKKSSIKFPRDSQCGFRDTHRPKMHRGNKSSQFLFLDEVSHIHGHSLNRSIVVLFNVTQNAPVLLRHEINGHTLATETSTATNSVRIKTKHI